MMWERRSGLAAQGMAMGWIMLMALTPQAWGCATCYGESDSPLAAGMNWGIMTMILVAYSVLFSIIGFFIFVARKAAASAALEECGPANLDSSARVGTESVAIAVTGAESVGEGIDYNELCSKHS